MSTLAEQWLELGEQRGRLKGRVEGRVEGRKEGYVSLVRRLIELKFGPVGASAVARLESADEATLERFSERVLTATRVEDVFGE